MGYKDCAAPLADPEVASSRNWAGSLTLSRRNPWQQNVCCKKKMYDLRGQGQPLQWNKNNHVCKHVYHHKHFFMSLGCRNAHSKIHWNNLPWLFRTWYGLGNTLQPLRQSLSLDVNMTSPGMAHDIFIDQRQPGGQYDTMQSLQTTTMPPCQHIMTVLIDLHLQLRDLCLQWERTASHRHIDHHLSPAGPGK